MVYLNKSIHSLKIASNGQRFVATLLQNGPGNLPLSLLPLKQLVPFPQQKSRSPKKQRLSFSKRVVTLMPPRLSLADQKSQLTLADRNNTDVFSSYSCNDHDRLNQTERASCAKRTLYYTYNVNEETRTAQPHQKIHQK